MDEAERVGRKIPSQKTAMITGSTYGRGTKKSQVYSADSDRGRYVAELMEKLASAFGRSVEAVVSEDEIIIRGGQDEPVRLNIDRAFSMAEEIRLILSPVLDRKA